MMNFKNTNPKFSVIIPAYNSEKYISRCVLSLIDTRFDDFEIIIVDDGSSDNTYSICKELSNKFSNIKLIHQENSGQMKARMNGVYNSKGDYICFVDSDDCVKENYFKVLATNINNNPNIDIIYFDFCYDYFKENTDLKQLEEKQYDSTEFVSKIYANDHFHSLWRACYKKEIVNINIYDEILMLKCGEDFCSFLLFASKSKYVNLIKSNLYIYSSNDDSITHKMISIDSRFDEIFKKEFFGYNILTNQFAINDLFKDKYLRLSLIHLIQILHYLYKSKINFKKKKEYSCIVLKEPYFKIIAKRKSLLSLYNKIYLLLFKCRFFLFLNLVEKVVDLLK